MPFRRKLKKARDYVQNAFSSPGNTRPSAPTSTPLASNLLGGDTQQLDDLGSNPSTISISTQTPTYSALGLRSPPNENSDPPSGAQQAQRSLNPIGGQFSQGRRSDLTVLDVGLQVPSAVTNPVPATENEPQLEEAEYTGAGGTSTQTGTHETQRMAGSAARDQTSMRWKSLNQFVNVLALVTNVLGPIKEVAEIFIDCVDKCEMTGAAKVEYEALRLRLEVLFHDLQGYFGEGCSPIMTSSMESLCKSIKEELILIVARQDRSTQRRYLESMDDADVILGCYRRVEGHLQRLSLNANLSMWRIAQEQAMDFRSDRMFARVDRLSPSLSARYKSAKAPSLKRRGCTQGTRVDVLAGLLDWVHTTGNGGVYWLNGMAGTGKTTIAYSLCEQLDAEHKLAASFFCSRLQEECRKVDRIIPSIAYQLARFSRPFQSAICAILEKDPDIHESIPEVQFQELLVKPLLEVERTLPEGMTVVIDALDECEDKWSTGHILDILLSESASLPIRFIVSSRPEPEIRDRISEGRVKSRLVLHELDKGEVQADIERYLREELLRMNPSDEQIEALVERAGILFIYAATAVRYIGYDNFQRNPRARLATIVNRSVGQKTTENKEIDELYTTILEAALGDEGLEERDRVDMQQVLNTAICAREPLTVNGLSMLLKIHDTSRVRAALRPLWSVLHVVETSELVTTLHASFPDFMFDSDRSNRYYCDSDGHHCKLAEHCFDQIANIESPFNICGLDSSRLPDEGVTNLKERVADAIPPQLFYACRYWADHIKEANCAFNMVEKLQGFLSTRLLVWMEVLNLTKQIKAGIECIKMAAQWCSTFEGLQELAELARDSKRFVEAFGSNAVSQSTPHIYASMMAFWPDYAPISKHYKKYALGSVKVEGPGLDRRQLAHLSTWAFDRSISALSVSPDGESLALRTGNEVLVVDSSSGRRLLGPLKGHTYTLELISFTPDGARLFTASTSYSTATIIGWDTRTGEMVFGPLELDGHRYRINSVCFTPDFTRIATGSNDKTVRLWDAGNGKMLHCLAAQDMVWAVAFSPDGTRIAARTDDTLQVWNTQTQETVLGPLTGLGPIDMIAFSPDQSRIICDSDHSDSNTIYVRDAQSGDTKLRLVDGHTSAICCIACSPDGRYIVSGSIDRTVQVWDAQNGNMVLGPLQGNSGAINSVAFSPDSSRIFSACTDGLVCTWDAQQHNLPPISIDTPSNRIKCVKFSSDGSRFVSGSEDGTLSIWDAFTGQMVLGPVKAHPSQINEVDFLNDRIVSGSEDGTICVCDAPSGEVVLGPLQVSPKAIKAISYSPNGELIATGSRDGVDVWDGQNGSRVLVPLTDLVGGVWSVRFSPDGTRIVACSSDEFKNVVVWDVSDGRNVFGYLHGHSFMVTSVSYSPNGALIASGSFDGTIIVWDAYTGKKALQLLTGHSDWVRSVEFSPDSTRLVSGSDDITIRIWDVQKGEMMFELPHGHDNWIQSVAYSPDGTRILSFSDDMTARIHDARTPKEKELSRSASDVGDWTINKDGWVVDDQSRLLVWVPGDLRKVLMRPRTQTMVGPHGYVRLGFDKAGMGESWAEGYLSRM